MKKFNIEIDNNRCKECGYCIYFCPQKCLSLSEEFNTKGLHYAIFSENDNAKCNGCGVCYIVCPDYCITVIEEKIT